MMENRKELIRFNENDFEWFIERCDKFADLLNEIYQNLIKDFPEIEIKKKIEEIKACVTERSYKEDKLKEILIQIILDISPATKQLNLSEELKRKLLGVENIDVSKYLPNAYHLFSIRTPKPILKKISWYKKNQLFLITKTEREKIKDYFSQYITHPDDLEIYDQVNKVILEITKLNQIANIDYNRVDLNGLGIQNLKTAQINPIVFT